MLQEGRSSHHYSWEVSDIHSKATGGEVGPCRKWDHSLAGRLGLVRLIGTALALAFSRWAGAALGTAKSQ